MTGKSAPWSVVEVRTLLSFVADENIQQELDGMTRNERVYLQLSEQMSAHGFTRTSAQ